MNDQQSDTKVCQDAAKVKKDINTLVGDSSVRFSKFEDKISQATGKAKDDVTAWVDVNVSQLSDGIEKLTGDARKTMVGAAATVKKEVGHGLSQYNTKAQEYADKIPGDFSKKAAGYPWVAITFALCVGFLLGIVVKPAQKPVY